jgi:CDP-glucose 4,6-dehydratase
MFDWRERRVFLTGHTGFKGGWMALWLARKGALVRGYALDPRTEPNLFTVAKVGSVVEDVRGDIRDGLRLDEAMRTFAPELVLHMAAQPLVRASYDDPIGTYETNVIGTARVLESVRKTPTVRAVISVTTDKVYENEETLRPYKETDALGGYDPYSSSKAGAELVTTAYRRSYLSAAGVAVATARAGNVIGGGDWSGDRLVPDCMRALDAGEPVALRFPEAVRPWQHVLEPLSGYLALLHSLLEAPESTPRAVNFGPDAASFCTVREVVDTFSARFGGRPGWRRDAGEHPAEAGALTLSSALAGSALGWRPRLDIGEALRWTVEWYLAHRAGRDMLAFTEDQIRRYGELMQQAP